MRRSANYNMFIVAIQSVARLTAVFSCNYLHLKKNNKI